MQIIENEQDEPATGGLHHGASDGQGDNRIAVLGGLRALLDG